MFLEVCPAPGGYCGGRPHPGRQHLPDVDPDEIYAALDADTRPYLKCWSLVPARACAGAATTYPRCSGASSRVHRDLARVTRATGRRRVALKRLVHRYGLLMEELGRRPDDLRRLVSSSHAVFDSLAGEEQNISTSVARLPGSLRASERALAEVRDFAPCCGPRSSRCANRSASCPRPTRR